MAKGRNNYRNKYADRYEAKVLFGNALRDGRVFRPDNCQHCGIKCVPQGHHNDYSKPLQVIWVCIPCHTEFHNCVKELEREHEKSTGVKIQDNSEFILKVAEWFWD